MIEQLIQIEPSKFAEVYHQSADLLGRSHEACAKKNLVSEDIKVIFRNLHTAKGLLRTYGLQISSAEIHDIEEMFLSLKQKRSKVQVQEPTI